MQKTFLIIIVAVLVLAGVLYTLRSPEPEESQTSTDSAQTLHEDIDVQPISHATMVLTWGNKVIYTDPVGGAEKFTGKPDPDIILVTDIHADHFSEDTLHAVAKEKTFIVMPQAVKDLLKSNLPGRVIIMKNGETTMLESLKLEAVPMYNLPESAESPHVKGRGNGYVIEYSVRRIYISGDTSDISEMRSLKNIDIAFICMNLPYTMSVDQAASAVLEFKPTKVYPYHYRGKDGLADINKFKELVNAGDANINVQLLNWYPGQ